MPPLPPWEGLHPLVVHFPVALITIAPLFVVLALLRPQAGFHWSAIIILALATASAFLATETGEAAEEIVPIQPELSNIIHEHEERAELLTPLTGVSLLLVVAAVLLPARIQRLATPAFRIGAMGVALVLLLVANVVLMNAGHLGARIVHEYGVQAPLTAEALRAAGADSAAGDSYGEHD